MLQIGDQFDHFQIRNHIARGGMGDVYNAYDLIHSREVALKIPDVMFIGDPAYYERFQRELDVMSILDHPALQKGVTSGRFKGMPFLVTEFIKGESLRDRLERTGPIPPDEAVQLVRRIADGLAYCHDHGIVHRDVKPDNVLITAEGQPILLDFGLALSNQNHRMTYANFSGAAGTPEYMSPEQIEGHRGDRRSDVYSLGIMFFEMVTGDVPFHGDTTMAVVAQHLHARIPRLDRERNDVSPQLATVVARCLQRKPKDRYDDMHGLIGDLDHLSTIDISQLDRMTGATTATPYTRSPFLAPFATAGFMILVLIIVGFILQALHAHSH